MTLPGPASKGECASRYFFRAKTDLTAFPCVQLNRIICSSADGLCIAVRMLKPAAANSKRCDFVVAIPASYEIVAPDNVYSGLLDGTPYVGADFSTGRHG